MSLTIIAVHYLKILTQVIVNVMLETFDLNSTFLNNWRYIVYDPSVSPEDDASKECLSEKYSKMLSYMEAVGFTYEVR